MRIVPIFFFLVFYFLTSIFVIAAGHVYRMTHPGKDADFVFYWVTWGFRQVRALSGMDLVVKGKENIPKDEAVLYVGNHQSYFDIVTSYGLMERPTGFVAKTEFLKIPVLSGLMKLANCLFLDRSDLRKGMEMINDATALLKRGVSVVIYPEGTRNAHPDTFLEFHKGSFKMAQRAGAPIIPMTITGSRGVFETQRPLIRKRRVVLEYGAPVRFAELEKEDQKNIHLYVKRILEETYRRNV